MHINVLTIWTLTVFIFASKTYAELNLPLSACGKIIECCDEIQEESSYQTCSLIRLYCSEEKGTVLLSSMEWNSLVEKCISVRTSENRDKRSPSRGLLVLFMKIHPKLNTNTNTLQGFSNDRPRRLGNRLGNEFLGKRTTDPILHYFKKYSVGLDYQTNVGIQPNFMYSQPKSKFDLDDIFRDPQKNDERELIANSENMVVEDGKGINSRDVLPDDSDDIKDKDYIHAIVGTNGKYLHLYNDVDSNNEVDKRSKNLGRRQSANVFGKPMFGTEFLGKRMMVGNEFLGKRGKRNYSQVGRQLDNISTKRFTGNEFLGKRMDYKEKPWINLKEKCEGKAINDDRTKAICNLFLLSQSGRRPYDTQILNLDEVLKSKSLPIVETILRKGDPEHKFRLAESSVCLYLGNCLRSSDFSSKNNIHHNNSKHTNITDIDEEELQNINVRKREAEKELLGKRYRGKVYAKPRIKGSEFLGKRFDIKSNEEGKLRFLKAITQKSGGGRGEPEYTNFVHNHSSNSQLNAYPFY